MGNSERLKIRPRRASFRASIVGAQAGNLIVPITDARFFDYTGAVTDSNPDISRWYQAFAIQSGSTTGRNAQVQIKLIGGDEWVVPPTPFTSDESGDLTPGLITPGDLFFMRLPTPGIMVRLEVTQPLPGTDFDILVSMSENSDVPLRT